MSTHYTIQSSNDATCVAPVAVLPTKPDAFIGIDFHKHYSVYHVVDAEGKDLAKGRVEHHSPEGFVQLVKRWQCIRQS